MEKINFENISLKIQPEDMTSDVIISNGSNSSKLVDAFLERYKFKVGGTPVFYPDGFDFMDVGYFYGKVDTFGRSIIPKEDILVVVNKKFTGGETVYLNREMYALYLQFYEEVKLDFAMGKMDIDRFMNVFRISKGASSSDSVEKNYKSEISEIIKNKYLEEVVSNSTSLVDDAVNFPLYLNKIVKLFELGKFDKSLLYSEYIISSKNPLLNSGLMFEIENEVSYDDNLAKFGEYYMHPVYGKVVAFLYLNGMRYDANAPWRFVMDFSLEATKKIMGGITKQQYFENNFVLAEGSLKEMKLFYDAIFLSYLSLFDDSPIIFKNEQILSICGRKQNMKTTKSYSFYRKLYSQNKLDDVINDNFDKFLFQYAVILNLIFKKGRSVNSLLLDLANKTKKPLDKEALVRYTFNRSKYC